jgi:hypothetical protein
MNAAAAANPMLQSGETSIGYIGLVFASVLQIVFTIYPKRLISQIIWQPTTNQLLIYTHSLFPYIRPTPISQQPSLIIPTGTALTTTTTTTRKSTKTNNTTNNPIGIIPEDEKIMMVAGKKVSTTTIPDDDTPLLLDVTSVQGKYLINQLQGQIQQYRGQLPIGYRWPYYLLDIHTSTNIRQPILYVIIYLHKKKISIDQKYLPELIYILILPPTTSPQFFSCSFFFLILLVCIHLYHEKKNTKQYTHT